MEKVEIDALLLAHGGRAQTVASLHLLRGEHHFTSVGHLSDAAHAFLVEHARALATIDLLRWRDIASPSQMPAVEAALLELRAREPARYEHEIKRVDKGKTAPDPPVSSPPDEGFFYPGEGLGDFFDALDGGEIQEEKTPEVSPHPELDALLVELADSPRGRKRTLWKARALSVAANTLENWASAVHRLPSECLPVVLVRAEVSPRGEERAALLEWLFQQGAVRSKLVDLTLSLLQMGPEADKVQSWVAATWILKLLPDEDAWSKHGARVVSTLIACRAFSALDDMCRAAIAGTAALGPGLLGMGVVSANALRSPLYKAFSKALLDSEETALTSGNTKGALAISAAMLALGPQPRDKTRILAMMKKRNAKGEVSTLLALSASRPRNPKDLPELFDFVAAVHALSDASG